MECVCGHGVAGVVPEDFQETGMCCSTTGDGRNKLDSVIVGEGLCGVLAAGHKLQIHGSRERGLNTGKCYGIGQGRALRQAVVCLVDQHLNRGVRHVQT